MRDARGGWLALWCTLSCVGCSTLPRNGGDVATFVTQTPLHFVDTAGARFEVPAGTYRAAFDSAIATLTPFDRNGAVVRITGKTLRHPAKLDGTRALLFDRDEHVVALLLLKADGAGLQVTGTRSASDDTARTRSDDFTALELEASVTQTYLSEIFRPRTRSVADARVERRGTRIATPFDVSASGALWQGQELLIYKGTIVDERKQQQLGLVDTFDAATRASCSAVLLSRSVVLTAGHCIEGAANPQKILVHATWNDPSRNQNQLYADAVYHFSNGFDLRGPDLALIHLPYPGLYAPDFWVNQLAGGAATVGTPFTAFGAGQSALYDPATQQPPNGYEVWRQADFKIGSIQNSLRFGDWEYYFERNPFQNALMSGDSGGPDLFFRDGQHAILGIHARPSGGNATTVLPTGTYSVSIPRFRNWLLAVMPQIANSWWSPHMPAFPIYARASEVTEMHTGVTDVNIATWSQASAAANTMCFNRGFFTGHFDGRQGDEPNRGFGVLCSGGGGASWRDVNAAEIAATGFAFTDVGHVHWAQANRAAAKLCEPGNVGGRFNGYQAGDKRGLVCYSRKIAQWFDATTDQLNALNHPIGDVNATPWAVAARAATEFCRTRGPNIYKTYQGGFFNGHQSGNKRGVVCLRTVAFNPLFSGVAKDRVLEIDP